MPAETRCERCYDREAVARVPTFMAGSIVSVLVCEICRVVMAWLVPGSQPAYHREKVRQLRAEWPMLAAALDDLAKRNMEP